MFLEVKRTESDKKDTLINSVSNTIGVGYNEVFEIMSKFGWSARSYKIKWDALLKRTLDYFGYDFIKISYPVSMNMIPSKLDSEKCYLIKQSKEFASVVKGKLLNHKNTETKIIHISFELIKK